MPYIKQDRREDFRELLVCFSNLGSIEAGELNYIITKLCLKFVGVKNYANYNTVMGILECVKQELYRKQIVAYEDKKEIENGTVWEDL